MRKCTHLSIAAILLAVGILLNQQFTAQSQVSTYADVQNEAKRGGYRLIDMDELCNLCQQESNNFILVDTRQD